MERNSEMSAICALNANELNLVSGGLDPGHCSTGKPINVGGITVYDPATALWVARILAGLPHR